MDREAYLQVYRHSLAHVLAKAVIENTTDKNQDILTLNSLQSVSQSDIDKGLTYYGAMEENLKVLAQSFNTEVK